MLVEDVRVMVIEGDSFQRRMLVRMLTDMGVKKINQAPKGHTALNILLDRIEPVDIVIPDLEMSTMDGMELIQHLGVTAEPKLHVFSRFENASFSYLFLSFVLF